MKNYQKLNKQFLIKSVRYSEDKPLNLQTKTNNSQQVSTIKNHLLMRHFPITNKLSPKLFQIVEECMSILELNNSYHDLSVFIYNSPEMNAQCFAGLNDNNIIITLSSSLVKFFTENELKFIIGHELGHYIFHSQEVKSCNGLENLMGNRSKEITADRCGLLCCQSIEVALKAMVKLLSGLNESDIVFDINSMLDEFKKIDVSNIPEEEIYSTHPPLPIRSKALLLFSMGTLYSELTGKDAKGLSQKSIDQKVKDEIEKYLDSRSLENINEKKNNFIFWSLSLFFLKDQVFDKKEQDIIRSLFGETKLQKLKTFIVSSSKKEAFNIVSKKCMESFHSYFREAPERSILYLKNFNKNLNKEFSQKDGLSYLLNQCPELKDYLKSA